MLVLHQSTNKLSYY